MERGDDVIRFLTGGNATFTLKSGKTGKRFTYKVVAPQDERRKDEWFVKLLTGPDNTSNYQGYGLLMRNEKGLWFRKRGGYDPLPARAMHWLTWVLRTRSGRALAKVEVWHEGRCSRCNRPLTDPGSIRDGIGPVCKTKMGG